MRSNLLIGGCVCLLGLAVATNSCAPHEESTPQENTVNDAVMRAREFLELETGGVLLPDTYLRTNNGEPTTRADKKFQGALSIAAVDLEPDWERAVHWKYKGDRVTEVPAVPSAPVSYFTLIKERGDTVSLAVQEPYTRIRVIESPNGKEIFGFVITLLPNENYTGELDDLDSNPVGSDYTGLSLYSALDGTPLWGWRYTNGEIVNTLLFSTDYENLYDPNVQIFMGFGSRSVTRAQDNAIAIDPVTVTGKRPDDGEDAGTGDIPGGGGPPPPPNNPNHHGGGGGSSGNSGNSGTPTPDTPLTDKLFEVDEVDAEKIEDMLEDLLIDCMGGKLFNGLDGRSGNINLTFTPGSNTSGFTPGIKGGLRLSSLNIGSLLHEMIHAYQYTGQTSIQWDSNTANREVEAYLAQYLFTKSYTGNRFGSQMQDLSFYLNNNGTLKDPSDEAAFNALFNDTAKHIQIVYEVERGKSIKYDDKQSGIQSIANIMNLAKDC